jgi:hypothetical protein
MKLKKKIIRRVETKAVLLKLGRQRDNLVKGF